MTDMNIELQPGVYVVAVSGGVDSMVMLDMLRRLEGVRLVVAHFDHGIRQDSAEDRALVKQVAYEYGLPFVYHQGELGVGASEELARQRRYEFLLKVRQSSQAKAIITAHHHDDVVETAVINILRGTGRKGLSSLKSTDEIVRPLLHLSKKELYEYAKQNAIVWREDSTNADTNYLRNYVRHKLLPKLSSDDLSKLKSIITQISEVNNELDNQLTNYMHTQQSPGVLDRKLFLSLPHSVAKEVMASWLRNNGIRDFDSKKLEMLVVRAKTLEPGKITDVSRGFSVHIQKDYLALKPFVR